MPVFTYEAFDGSGKRRRGLIEAASLNYAVARLKEEGVYPVSLKETKEIHKITVSGKVSPKDIALVTRQLATLLAAGLPLVPALSALVAQTTRPAVKNILLRIREEVNEGKSLSAAMGLFPRVFSPFYINMVKAGEASGAVEEVLERLADFTENQEVLKTKIKSALAYPFIMFSVGVLVVLFLVTFVVPNITKIFEEMHQSLPWVTLLLISVSSFLKSFWWLLLLFALFSFLLVRQFIVGTTKGRYLWDWLKIKIPLLGAVNLKLAVARFSRTLGTLLKSGVPLLTSLEIAESIVGNRLLGEVVREAAKEVEEGQSLSRPLSKSPLFPPMACEMIAVGEQGGNLETLLHRVADAFEREAASSIMTLTSLLEPLMILLMGAMVGFIVVSVLLPIFEMNQLVR